MSDEEIIYSQSPSQILNFLNYLSTIFTIAVVVTIYILLKEKLQYNLSFYRTNISNLLVSRRTDFDEYIGINAGKTTHEGIEFELNKKEK